MQRRRLSALALAAGLACLAVAPAVARADDAPAVTGDVGDREIGGTVGLASGSHATPGGLHLGGRFLYQLSDRDWFDGEVAFTFGSGDAACFHDRADVYVCEHGLLDGFAGELGGGVRRFFPATQGFRPYLRAAVAARIVRFGGDQLTGFAIPVSGAAGLRYRITDSVALGGEAALEIGPGWFGHGLSTQLERGFTVGVVAEVALP